MFSGLWIEKHWNWAETFPVVRISFRDIGVKTKGLSPAIKDALALIAQQYEIVLEETQVDAQLKELVTQLSKINKVVILIDEYDKPVIDSLKDKALAEQNRATLKILYSVRERCDAVVQTDGHIFILEFKLNQSAQVALNSIFERGYLEKFKNTGKELVAMGVNFDGVERKVDGVMVKKGV